MYRSVPARCLMGRWPCSSRHELVGLEVTQARMRTHFVVQQGLRTPTVPSFGNCCIRGIHGPACGSAFMRQLRGRAVLSFAAT